MTKNNLICKEDIFPIGIPLNISILELKYNFKEQNFPGLYLLLCLVESNYKFLKNRGIL